MKTSDYDDDAMHLYKINSTGFESRYYFKEIVYQGSTKQDAVASSLMAAVKKIFNGPIALNVSLRLSCPLQGLLYPYLNYQLCGI